MFLLPEQAHSNVVPELWGLRRGSGCHAILGESNVVVTMALDHGSCSQDSLGGRGREGGGEGGREGGREGGWTQQKDLVGILLDTLELLGSNVSALPRQSKAFFVSPSCSIITH